MVSASADEIHLAELRRRILVSLLAVGLLSVAIAVAFGSDIIRLLIRHFLPPSVKVIAQSPVEYAYTWFAVVLFFGVYLALPLVIYEAFKFVEPGLYPNERRVVLRVVPLSFALFTLGVAFAFLILIPVSVRFLISYSVESAEPMLSLHRFISFIGFMLIGTGIIFQLPLVVALIVRSGVVGVEQLKSKRRYIYAAFAAFSIAAVPDPSPVAPLAVGVTLVLVFELSLLLSECLL